jgi:hypothetical protein
MIRRLLLCTAAALVGCGLFTTPAMASVHFTSHQRAQLKSWYRSHHSVIIKLAVRVNATSNFTGNQCSKLLGAVPDGKEEGTIPVTSVDKTWDSAVVNILLAVGACVATTETVAQEETQLKTGAQELQTVIHDFRAAGVNVVIPAPPPTTTTVPPPTTTTTSPAQYEAACTNAPTYGALASPNAQTGTCVTFEAQIFQYDTRTGTTEMLVDVTNDGYGLWTDTVELQLPQSVVSQNFIENDVIRFWGTTAAADTYQTASGGSNTVPVVDVKYATLVSTASS